MLDGAPFSRHGRVSVPFAVNAHPILVTRVASLNPPGGRCRKLQHRSATPANCHNGYNG